eukprot:2576174-Rhodomonas_salina.1
MSGTEVPVVHARVHAALRLWHCLHACCVCVSVCSSTEFCTAMHCCAATSYVGSLMTHYCGRDRARNRCVGAVNGEGAPRKSWSRRQGQR